jgi:hypothetical protein
MPATSGPNGIGLRKEQENCMAKYTQEELAARWHLSPRTLEQWRWLGKGPRFLKIGARVLYDETEIERYEAGNLHQCTMGPLPPEAG